MGGVTVSLGLHSKVSASVRLCHLLQRREHPWIACKLLRVSSAAVVPEHPLSKENGEGDSGAKQSKNKEIDVQKSYNDYSME